MDVLFNTEPSHNDANIMIAAILSLLLVLFFVTLLHCYAKWFLAQESQTSNGIIVVPPVLGGGRLVHLHNFLIRDISGDQELSPSTKGLEPHVISSIPEFVYREHGGNGLECVICLGLFENEQQGRKLVLCHHAFHVECIDMWLHSHTTCPVCRAPAVSEKHECDAKEPNCGESFETTRVSDGDVRRLEIVVEVPNVENGSNGTMCTSKVPPSSNNVDERI